MSHLKVSSIGNADLTPRIALETEESVVLSAPNGHWRNHWMESPNGRTSEDTLTPGGVQTHSNDAMTVTK